MSRVIKTFVISTALLLAGCSSNAPILSELQSKELKPPKDAALVYIVRQDKMPLGVVSLLDIQHLYRPDFSVNGKRVGEIENNRYLYFYSYPMELDFVTVVEGKRSLLKMKIEAERTYYLRYSNYEGYYRLSQEEGVRFLRELHMSGNFKPIIIGTKPSNSPVVAAGKKSSLDEKQEDYLRYDDNTKLGVIKYRADIEDRSIVLRKIEEICNTKNVALIADESKETTGASYKTLDETIENDIIEMKFQCLY